MNFAPIDCFGEPIRPGDLLMVVLVGSAPRSLRWKLVVAVTWERDGFLTCIRPGRKNFKEETLLDIQCCRIGRSDLIPKKFLGKW